MQILCANLLNRGRHSIEIKQRDGSRVHRSEYVCRMRCKNELVLLSFRLKNC